jgi:hypothetical protein
MKYRFPLILGITAVLAVGAWMALRPPELPHLGPTGGSQPPSMTEAKAASVPGAPKLSAAAVLSIDPRNRMAGAAAKPRVTLYTEFQGSKGYKALYDRLAGSPEGQTPEGWYVQYEILRKCATITDRNPRTQPVVRTTDQKRDEFLATLPANDPQRDKRIAAFDDVTTNRCAGLENVQIRQADLNKLLADAALGGDPKARALQIEQDLWTARRADGRWRSDVAPTDAQFDSLRTAISTRDPEAMMIAGRVLSSSWNEFSLRIGTDAQVVEQRSFMQAWQLLACDYGAPCGSDNQRLLSACAYQGHCNAQTLPDYIFFYGASPYDSQLLTQYREVLRSAIDTGNWSQLNVVRGPVPSTARATNNPPGPGR